MLFPPPGISRTDRRVVEGALFVDGDFRLVGMIDNSLPQRLERAGHHGSRLVVPAEGREHEALVDEDRATVGRRLRGIEGLVDQSERPGDEWLGLGRPPRLDEKAIFLEQPLEEGHPRNAIVEGTPCELIERGPRRREAFGRVVDPVELGHDPCDAL